MVTTSVFGKAQSAARMIISENRKHEHSERDRAILPLLASGEREIEAGEQLCLVSRGFRVQYLWH